LLGGLFGGGKPKPQTYSSTTNYLPDASSQAQIDYARKASIDQYQRAQRPFDPNILAGYQRMSQGIPFGMQRGATGIGEYFNPYQSEVIGGVQGDYDRMRQEALSNAMDQATRAGAFGGNRAGVLQAMTQRDLYGDEAQHLARLRQGGYDQSMGYLQADRDRAMGYGMAGLEGQLGLLGMSHEQRMQALQMLQQSTQGGGYQSRTSGVGPPLPSSGGPFSGMLGGALAGAGMFT
jgi:hypothetical protein